jgi:predicted RNase H-like nuclease (RuvC/YqgF family)
MNAVMREKRIVSEERLARIESDVAQLRSDVNPLQADVVEMKGDVREIRDDIKTINAKFADFREHVAKEFGSMRASIEQLRTAIEQGKLWMLVTAIGTMLTMFTTIGHALKLF